MRKLSAFLILAIAVSAFALLPGNTAHIGARFNLALPQGEFKDYVDNVGFGGDFDVTYAINPFINVGLAGGYIQYGEETRSEPFSYTISTVFVDVITQNQLGYLHLVGRISPGMSKVNPYVEGRFGGSYIWTATRIESEVLNDDNDVIAESKNFDDFAFNAGFGGGLHIRLGKPDKDEEGTIYLDLKVLYMYGSNAEYLTEGSIDDSADDLDVTYYVSESETSLLEIMVGVDILF